VYYFKTENTRQETQLEKRNEVIATEKAKSDNLLLNILPRETAEELKETGRAKAKSYDSVSVFFSDIKGFTTLAEHLPPAELVAEIDYYFRNFDRIVSKYNIEKIKTIGDAYMCAGGIPEVNTTHASDLVSAALEIQELVKEHKEARLKEGRIHFEVRIGIHTGPVVAGIVGERKFAYDIWGDTVNIAARMESSGEVGKVNISGATYTLIKDRFRCTYRGKVSAKGKGEIDMYFVDGPVLPNDSQL
jgi:class 3 adenylate cyclase